MKKQITFRVPVNMIANLETNTNKTYDFVLKLVDVKWDCTVNKNNKGTYFLATKEFDSITLQQLTERKLNAKNIEFILS